MRWSFVAVVVVALGLQGCSSSTPSDAAALKLTDALTKTCEPWMKGVERESLNQTLIPGGWALTANAGFLQSGAWGRVDVTLLQPGTPLQRACLINFNSSLEPWSLKPASAAIEQWVSRAYPNAVKATDGPSVVDGRAVDMQAWVADDVKFVRGVQKEKQIAPTFDLFFMVRRD